MMDYHFDGESDEEMTSENSENLEDKNEDEDDDIVLKLEDNDQSRVDDVPASRGMTKEEMCSVCTTLLPKVTTENLQFLKEVVLQLEILHERRLENEAILVDEPRELRVNCTLMVDEPRGSRMNGNIRKPRINPRATSIDKVELISGSGVFVDRKFLANCHRNFRYRPREAVRRLLKQIIGLKDLIGMSATGEWKKKYKKIPPTIKVTVHDWIQRNCKPVLSLEEYNRTINLMCGDMRRKEQKERQDAENETP